MCVNKDLKMAITNPTKPYLQKVYLFLRYRISVHKILLTQSFPPKISITLLCQLFVDIHEIKKTEGIILVMLEEIQTKGLLPTSITANHGLVNIFSNIKAMSEQRNDLLNFREIGSTDTTNYIKHSILNIPSTRAPVQKKTTINLGTTIRVCKQKISFKNPI